MSILEIADLQVTYQRPGRSPVIAVDGVKIDVNIGEIVALVGESGCGKSTVARAAVGLVTPTGGTVRYRGRQIEPLGRGTRRGSDLGVQLVFQNPYGSLNPRRLVGDQILDGLSRRKLSQSGARRAQAVRLLNLVGLGESAMDRYPHQFSGGQRQRIAVARALASEPQVLILDEPLAALDASAQAQMANLLRGLTLELGIGMLLISHDLSIVRHVADRMVVMYLGHVVEAGRSGGLWEQPSHPYTRALISAIPSLATRRPPEAIEGEIPDPAAPPPGCRFHPRCPLATDECRTTAPPFVEDRPGHTVACWHHAEVADQFTSRSGAGPRSD